MPPAAAVVAENAQEIPESVAAELEKLEQENSAEVSYQFFISLHFRPLFESSSFQISEIDL